MKKLLEYMDIWYMAQNLAPQKKNFEITHSATKYGVGRSAC